MFVLSFANFIALQYTLIIERFAFAKAIFPSMVIFLLTFIVIYPLVAILLGRYVYRFAQWKTDQAAGVLENPFLYKATPGIQRQVGLPITLLTLNLIVKLVNNESLTQEDNEEIALGRLYLRKLIEGGSV